MRFIRFLHVAAAFILIACASLPARAQTTWVGTSGTALWDIGSNWSSGTAPVSGGTTSLVFAGSTLLSSTNNIANLTLSGLTLSNTSVATNTFVLSGSTVNLTGQILVSTGAVVMNSDTIAFGMVLKADIAAAVQMQGNRTLTISGAIGQDASARNFVKTGNGTLILTNTANSFNNLGVAGTYGVQISQFGTVGSPSQTGTGALISFNGGVLTYTGTGETSDKRLQVGTGNQNSNGAAVASNGSGALNLIGSGGLFTTTWSSTVASRTLTIQGSNADNNTIAATITDVSGSTALALTKSGAGKWILSGSNTYTGATTVSAGTLQIGSGSTTGLLNLNSSISVSAGATLAFSRSDTMTQGNHFNSVISGAGNVTQVGPGTLVLNGANTYTGTTTVSAGTLRFATQTALYNNGTANWIASKINVKSGATLALNVGGSGEFTQGDVSTLLTNLASSTSASTGMNAGAILGFDTTNASTPFEITSAIADTGGSSGGARGLVKLGGGTLTLSASNSYTGTTSVNGGTLSAASNALANTSSITVNGATLSAVNYNSSASLSLDSSGLATISGAGLSLGTVTNANTTANALDFTSTSGTITLTSLSGAGNSRFRAGASIGGTVSQGSVTINGVGSLGTVSGGTIAFNGASASITTLSGGRIDLANNVALSVQDGTFGGAITGAGSLAKKGTGLLALSGANTYSGLTTIESGTLRMAAVNTIASSSGVTLGSGGGQGTFDLNGHDQDVKALTFASLGGTVQNSTGSGELFMKNLATGTATITVQSSTMNSISPTMKLSSNTVIDVNSGAALGLLGSVQGTGSLTKSGSGTLTLHGNNSFSGGTYITGGSVVVTGGATPFGTGAITLSDFTTLDLGGKAITNSIAFASNSATVAILNSGTFLDLVSSGNVSSGGAPAITADYRVKNGATVDFQSPLAGQVQIESGKGFFAAINDSGDVTVATGAQAVFSGTVAGSVATSGSALFSGPIRHQVTVNGGTATFAGATLAGASWTSSVDVNGGRAIFSGTVGGSAHVGSGGTAEFSNRITGGLTVDAGGQATLGNGATYESADLENAGMLIVNRTTGNDLTLATRLGGTGSFLKQGGGTLTLTGANDFTGALTVSSGTVQIGDGGTNGSIVGNVVNNAALVFNRSDATTYGGLISGSGLVRLLGGSLTLSSSNSYSGGTWIDGGTLMAGHEKAFGSGMITLGSGATLDLNHLLVTNAITNNGGTIRGGTITGEVSGTTTLTSGQTTFDSTIGAGAQINVAATGTAEFGNNASFNAGAKVVNDGIMRVSRSVSGTLAIGAVVSGSGRLQIDSGKARLDAANTYTGNTVITGSGSVLALGAGGSFDHSPTIVVGNAGSIGAVLDLTAQGGAGNTFTFNADQKLMGKGTIDLDGATLRVLGTLAPGNSPGNLTINGNLAWQTTDAGYQWEINNATGTAGTNWDLLTVTGVLDLSALSATNKYLLDLTTLTSSNTAGLMDNYVDGSNYTWSLVTASSVLLSSGTAAAGTDITNLFTVSFANWANTKPSAGNYSVKVASDGAGINLVIIPEPDTIIFAGIGIAMAGWSLWKRRRIAQMLRK